MNKFAKVIVAYGTNKDDKAFSYAIPQHLQGLVDVGFRVLVPFGGSRQLEGYVLELADTIDFDPAKIKYIADVLEDFAIFTPAMLKLAAFMAKKYYTTTAICLKAIMPAGIAMKNDYVAVAIAQDITQDFKKDDIKLAGRKKQIYNYILTHGSVGQRELLENFGKTTWTNLKALEEKSLITLKHIYDVKDYAIRINTVHLNDNAPGYEESAQAVLEAGGKQALVLNALKEARQIPMADIQLRLGISPSPIKSLEKKGLVLIKKQITHRQVLDSITPTKPQELILTNEQANAISIIKQNLKATPPTPTLVQGVTGSGKTEVYMQIIESVLAEGKQAIMLVPEISLTPQVVDTFVSRFGSLVTYTHSRMSLGERYDQWKMAKDGRLKVIIGPRSAIFTPFDNLGLIIIDEEHENTYKSENTPKYDTKEVAFEISRLVGCAVVLGSATPNVATYHKAILGQMSLVTLKERVSGLMDNIEIADMRRELAMGNKSILSAQLYSALGQNLASGGQSILFINRRGHSTFVSCRSCGHVLGCFNCNVNYTYHMYSHKLMCHYCQFTLKMPKNCPTCGSIYIKHFGIGTQKIEEYIKENFPTARVLRMDLDTTTKKNSHSQIIETFAQGAADILVGTQMIAKGLNFPGVNLVGIVAADIALNNGDFKAAETAYQLITQVAGRATRGKTAGRVIIQTYCPEHYSIEYAKSGDYEAFYNHEINMRRQMEYYPFADIFQVLFVGQKEDDVIKAMHRLAKIMHNYNQRGICAILGPAPAYVSKIRGNYRWKLLAKSKDEEILKKFVFYCLDKLEVEMNLKEMGIGVNLTINPSTIA